MRQSCPRSVRAAAVEWIIEGKLMKYKVFVGQPIAEVALEILRREAEVTVYPWKEPPELKARTINRVRTFLKAHQPATAMR